MTYIDEIATKIGTRCGMRMTQSVERAMLRIYAVLCLAKGEDTTSEDVHNAWSAAIAEAKPSHVSLLPFLELSPETQRLDDAYRDAIRAVAREERRSAMRDLLQSIAPFCFPEHRRGPAYPEWCAAMKRLLPELHDEDIKADLRYLLRVGGLGEGGE
jgi:hypothetical protein